MRLHSQGTRDGHTLAHSSRKLMRKLVFKAVETDKIDVVPREFLTLVRGQPLHFETESNVLGNIHPGKRMGTPSTAMLPVVRGSNPAAMFSKVVLPQPL